MARGSSLSALECALFLAVVGWPPRAAGLRAPLLLPVQRVRLAQAAVSARPRGARTARLRLLAMSGRTPGVEYDREGYRVDAPSAPAQNDGDASTWAEGNKAGFSVVADWGTAEHVTLPADCVDKRDGSSPPQVKLALLLMLLDPARFPSKSAAKKKVRQGVVLVNGRKGKIDSLITIGKDRITMQSRTESRFKPLGEPPFHINVIYEDDVMAVVHKPPGVCTHPPKGGAVPQTQVGADPGAHPCASATACITATARFAQCSSVFHSQTTRCLPQQAQSMMSMRCCVPYHVKCAPPGSEGILWRPMLVHRLDKDTEGIQVRGRASAR